MKKITFLFSILAFIFLSFVSSFAAFSFMNAAFAQEELSIKEATVSADSKTTKSVEYELPYPGLLPDNPLYFIKMIRDKIVGFLISDPKKKAEFDLLQSDKRLNAGVHLFNEKKLKEAISVISKAQNYFEEALQKVKEAKGQGMETTEITNKLIDSSKKHQEILKSLEEKSPQNFKSSFDSHLKRADKFVEEAISLTLKKLDGSK